MGKGSEKGKRESHETKRQKLAHRPKINVQKILSPELYDFKNRMPNYMTMRAAPSQYPSHKYCSVCGYTKRHVNTVIDSRTSTSVRAAA